MIYFKMIAAVCAGEVFAKKMVKKKEEEGIKSRMLPGGIEIRRLENGGAAAGMLSGHKKILNTLSCGILAALSIFLMKERKKKSLSLKGTGAALMIGGGFCNFIDRIKTGTVTDYIRFTGCPVKCVQNLVFNFSDFAIIIGGLLSFVLPKERKDKNRGNNDV